MKFRHEPRRLTPAGEVVQSGSMPRFEPTPLAEDAYRPISPRQRLAIVVLAIVTAVGAMLILLDPPGGVVRKRAAIPECAASAPDAKGCVGGMATVIAPAASK